MLVPCPGLEPMPPALEAWSLNQWTTREIFLNVKESEPFFFLKTNAKQSALGAKSKNLDFDTRGKVTYWSLGVQQFFCVWKVFSPHGTRILYTVVFL